SHEAELKRARQDAEDASRAKDVFLAALSHELRTPLNPVLLVASDALVNQQLEPAVRDAFEMIRRNVELEARLIDDLLDLTRFTRGKLVLDKVPLHAHKVLQESISILRPEIEQKGLRLEEQFLASQDLISGDTVRLQQIFWNILKNSIKFTPAKGTITVK